MSELRCGVLGELTVDVDGRPVRVPPGRVQAVLACLLAHAGRPVPADTLIAAAWGADLPRDPHGALHTVLSRLRARLGAGVVLRTAEGYSLRLAPGALDAEEFEDLVERASRTGPSEGRSLLNRALGLWRGPAFGDLAEAPFAEAAAARLERLRMDAVELHASLALADGTPWEAIAPLEHLLADQPFREHAMELLAAALYHAGRQAEALERLRAYRSMLVEELGLDVSPPLARLESRILGHDLAPAGAGPPAWLDLSTAFVGRETELADLVAAVARDRVTVVTGPGGVGKSRLAAEALAALHARVSLPVAVVELAGVAPGGAAAALADALGLRGAAQAEDDVLEYLGAVPHLLVLDSCEHLLDDVRGLVSRILRRCRDVRVLATSRRRLGVPTERVLPLAPLRVSGDLSAAVRLFTDRVRRLRPGFTVTPGSAARVTDLCRRTEGLPLALEVAASRAATLGIDAVLADLSDAPAGDRLADLDTVVAWSYRLLTTDERALLDVLSVFPGELTAAAVRRVTGHLGWWRGDPVAGLSELVESSLVKVQDTGTGRYRLLALVRAFAAHRLDEAGRTAEVRLAHARWVQEEVVDLASRWRDADGADLGARLTDLRADLTAAVRWSLDAGHLQLAAVIAGAVGRCLHWMPGLELGDLLVRTAERARTLTGGRRAEVTAGTGEYDATGLAAGIAAGAFFSAERGRYGPARALAAAALERSEGDAAAIATLALGVAAMYAGQHTDSAGWFRRLARFPGFAGEAHSSLALLACYADDLPSAREHAAVALAAGPSGADASHAFARYAAGEVEARSDPARGAVLLAEAADEADRVGAEQVSRVARVALFALLVRTGRTEEAVALGRHLLGELRRWGVWPQVWTTLRMLAELLADPRPADAAFLLGAARAAPSAPPLVGHDVDRYAAVEARLVDRLGQRVVRQIHLLAATTPRARVLSRAEHLLAGSPATPAPGA